MSRIDRSERVPRPRNPSYSVLLLVLVVWPWFGSQAALADTRTVRLLDSALVVSLPDGWEQVEPMNMPVQGGEIDIVVVAGPQGEQILLFPLPTEPTVAEIRSMLIDLFIETADDVSFLEERPFSKRFSSGMTQEVQITPSGRMLIGVVDVQIAKVGAFASIDDVSTRSTIRTIIESVRIDDELTDRIESTQTLPVDTRPLVINGNIQLTIPSEWIEKPGIGPGSLSLFGSGVVIAINIRAPDVRLEDAMQTSRSAAEKLFMLGDDPTESRPIGSGDRIGYMKLVEILGVENELLSGTRMERVLFLGIKIPTGVITGTVPLVSEAVDVEQFVRIFESARPVDLQDSDTP